MIHLFQRTPVDVGVNDKIITHSTLISHQVETAAAAVRTNASLIFG